MGGQGKLVFGELLPTHYVLTVEAMPSSLKRHLIGYHNAHLKIKFQENVYLSKSAELSNTSHLYSKT